jgi:hypothetical protein
MSANTHSHPRYTDGYETGTLAIRPRSGDNTGTGAAKRTSRGAPANAGTHLTGEQ